MTTTAHDQTGRPTTTDVDALVIGAGFSGLAVLHHLREIGLKTLDRKSVV